MALFYDLESACDRGQESVRAFFADELHGTLMDPDGLRYLRIDGLDASPITYDPSSPEEQDNGRDALLGFVRQVGVEFRFANLAASATTSTNHVIMMKAVLAFFEACPGDGVLMWNGERIVLQRYGDEIAFDSEWEDFSDASEEPELLALARQYVRRPLAQPLL